MASLIRTNLCSALRYASSSSAPVASSSKVQLTPTLARYNSTSSTPSSSEPTPSEEPLSNGPTSVKYSYFVPRVGKTLDSLPVYTDIRNGGTRTITELRKIQGSIEDLKTDLSVFLAETYATADPELNNVESPLKVNKKPLRPRAGRKLVEKTGNPTYMDPVQTGKVQESGKLKIRGNRVEEVKAFLESRGF
ncbi:related to IMG2 - mitochondrial ribosomal protein of the large subunit [Ustilago sp. UG-2017b]|nr:related to IMG2 - mitochondrial ribosomal protein of the large subunit [Ustilago sp. UG-2017b]